MRLYITIQFGSWGHLALSGGYAWFAVSLLSIFMLFVTYIVLSLFK